MGNYIQFGLKAALGAPATDDQAGNAALTFIDMKGYSMVPTNRFTTSDIDTEDLESGIIIGQKGGGTGDNQTIGFHTSKGTDGHAEMALWGGFGQDQQVTFQVINKDASVARYLTGILRNYKPKQGDLSSDDGFTVDFRQNIQEFVGTPTV